MKYIIYLLMTRFSLWRRSSDSHSVPEWWLPVQTSPVWTSARSFVCWCLLERINRIVILKIWKLFTWQKHLCHEELCLHVDSKFHMREKDAIRKVSEIKIRKRKRCEEMRTKSGWRWRWDKHDVRWKLEDEGGEQTKKDDSEEEEALKKVAKMKKKTKRRRGWQVTKVNDEAEENKENKDVKTATKQSKPKRRNRWDENKEREHK